MKFQCIYNTPKDHENGPSSHPKVSKMSSLEVPEVIKITKMFNKVRSNENKCIHYTFDRLGHQKSADFQLPSIPANPFSLLISNQLATGCQRGRRQGRSLIYPPRQAEGRTPGVFNFKSRFSPLQGSPEKESPSPAGYP